MCVSRCRSPACHEEIYGDENGPGELEPGEIDDFRADKFERCVKDEIRRERAAERQNEKAALKLEEQEQQASREKGL